MAQRFKSLLSGSPELRALSIRARALSELQHEFASVAPPYLAQCSQVLGLHFGTLSVGVTNATAAAKLRQLAPELVVLLQNKGCEVSGIRIKVQVSFPHDAPKTPPRELSQTAQDALKGLSERVGDSPLGHALERMTQHKK